MTETSPHPAYRGDIDGLRAVAVLSVVLYHFGLPLRGGFTGVDVFFVISGYLIGGLMWREYCANDKIRIGAFYLRRFRRLAPAFFAMVLGTAALGWVLLLPFEYREFGKSAVAASFYLSNFLFWRQTGYFDAAAHDKPLLHTWSLAVEEQFYIFLPLMFLLLARSRRAMIWALVACWAASLVACVLMTPQYPSASFYLFPFRAWEMLSGVLLAIWGQTRGTRWEGWRALSWVGLGLVLLSVVMIPSGPLFPGLLATVPVLGTLLVLANGRNDGAVNRLLRLPAFRFFGLISYSLYLWHWPVVTLSNSLRDGYANPFEALIWMALSVGLAWLSWRFVEQPVRRAVRLPGWVLAGGTVLASAAVLGFGLFLRAEDGLPGRFGPEAGVHIAASADFLQDFSRCYVADDLPLDGLEVCPIGPEGPPQVLIWGDSHVRAFYEGLALAADEAGVPAMVLWRAGCPPLIGLRKVESAATPAQNTACRQANMQIKQALGRLNSVQRVLLIGRWGYYATGQGTGLDANNLISIFPTERPERVAEPQVDVLSEASEATVDQLLRQFGEVYVLRQPPEVPFYDSRRAARETAHARLPFAAEPVTQSVVPREDIAARAALADAPWRGLVASGRVGWLDPWPWLCDDATCSAVHSGTGQYFDNNHMTNSAARRLRDVFAPVFRGDARGSALNTVPLP
ncbi:peptidoglycan/LPS O-acetylase OafA/YrhL [Sagittula marina]|uniref:Peptidoglycan/LPS O-acetylase OafA/YrhL n=1 Tax=Sagittula marina TaxID=943940 RepID=A0A7W6DJE2_9RHOB|nr:acyltransferase family protein [Sagittula marina]MBB3983842.1 peptidoglycan/LPS O-acetylase OafA/YrhL [Sagittula marina]